MAASPVHIACCGEVSYDPVRDLVLVCEGSFRLGDKVPLTPRGQECAQPHLFHPRHPEVTFWGGLREAAAAQWGSTGLTACVRTPGTAEPPDPRLLHSEKTKPCLLSFFAIIQMERTNEIFFLLSLTSNIFKHPLSAKYQSPFESYWQNGVSSR